MYKDRRKKITLTFLFMTIFQTLVLHQKDWVNNWGWDVTVLLYTVVQCTLLLCLQCRVQCSVECQYNKASMSTECSVPAQPATCLFPAKGSTHTELMQWTLHSPSHAIWNKNRGVQAMAWKKVWTYLDLFRAIKSYLDPFRVIWSHLKPCVASWSPL